MCGTTREIGSVATGGGATPSYPVPVLLECVAVLGYQDRAERLVTRLERLLRELDAPAKVTPLGLSETTFIHVDSFFRVL
jgi:hypothetical protein